MTLDRRTLLGTGGLLGAALALPAAAQTPAPRTAFIPGEVWLDTAGKPIQAHGGSIIQVGDSFYWYGENKEFTTRKSKIWTWGIRCYGSKDLYNWTDLGLIIPPDEKDSTSPLHPFAKLDRPHIIFNKRTKKFVCWIKLLDDPRRPLQTRSVLTADAITGPYTLVRKDIVPLGMGAGISISSSAPTMARRTCISSASIPR